MGEAIVSALEIRNCRNTGAVRGFAVCGGILGEAKPERDVQETTLLVADCVNSGSVYVVNPGGLTTELYAGGMVAKCPLAEITDELLPMFTDLRIEDCRNTGTLDGDREGGPFAGMTCAAVGRAAWSKYTVCTNAETIPVSALPRLSKKPKGFSDSLNRPGS